MFITRREKQLHWDAIQRLASYETEITSRDQTIVSRTEGIPAPGRGF